MRNSYEKELVAREQKLLREISGMKLSFKKLRKVLALDALLHVGK